MDEILAALALGMAGGFVLGFAAAYLLVRRTMKLWEQAYKLATAEATRGVPLPDGGRDEQG